MSTSFIDRHNGPNEKEIAQMLSEIGVSSLEELVNQTVPADILMKEPLDLDEPISEQQYLARLKKTLSKNKNLRSLIGLGFYGTGILPAVIRNVYENPVWYTSYTPYQAEISQGRLEALLNFQTMVASLTGFQLANSSMLDDSTAAAEAARMMFELRSRAAKREGKNVLFIDENIFPQVLAVVKTRMEPLNVELEIGNFREYQFNPKAFGAILQYPAANGEVSDYSSFTKEAAEKEVMVTAVTDLMALAIMKEPAAWGADIAVGTAQRFGLPMGFGGPTAGFLATHEEHKRHLPGRIIGVSIDRHGNKALRMALQTREQHIKRERATSNICTAAALMSTMTGMYAVYHGPEGLKRIASKIFNITSAVASELEKKGYKLATKEFFDTLQLVDVDSEKIRGRALAAGYNLYYPDESRVQFSLDELTTIEEAKELLAIFEIEATELKVEEATPSLPRVSTYMEESTFNDYHSETELMRYIKKLERRDLSLTHSMIPLGSCTMKLNAAVEMMPLTWSEVIDMHPYVPIDQAQGHMEMIKEVERDLAVITGFAATSLQPNSGASGEYAGLMTIRAFHLANGDTQRDVAIIPTSAHGTNPASAAMAGMEIVLVASDERGNVDVEDFREKAIQYRERLSCAMITYPSTHGVYEAPIKEICEIIHENGGLVYMDGANMNAQVGLTSPGSIGADVCHLNLHKTFAIPHGGGGPGIGPICVTAELAPFLPDHPFMPDNGENRGVPGVSSAPFGYPSALPVTHAYIKLLGPEGLKRATEVAILNANYISAKLKDHYETLYTGLNDRVAHESILDLRHFRREYGVDATDIAKRLMDYGFHAPTLSFPVVDTLMVEPTESESKGELDRFIEAMISIKKECDAVKSGEYDAEDNPLKMAPHTVDELTANEWKRPYSREIAAYPLEWIRENKFWPHVARVDNAHGDRNLMCSVKGWLGEE